MVSVQLRRRCTRRSRRSVRDRAVACGQRADAILKATAASTSGPRTSLPDQLLAEEWEITKGEYSHVLPAVNGTTTLWSAMTVLVSRFERSGSQARDIKRRVGLAEGWAKVLNT